MDEIVYIYVYVLVVLPEGKVFFQTNRGRKMLLKQSLTPAQTIHHAHESLGFVSKAHRRRP